MTSPTTRADFPSVSRIDQPASVRLAGKNRRQQHHGYDGQILKDENSDRRSAMDRVAVSPFCQGLQHDRRAAQREEKSPEHPLPPGQSDEHRPDPRDQQHAADLDRRGDET